MWKKSGARRILDNNDLIKEIKEKLEEYVRTDFATVVSSFEQIHMGQDTLREIFKEDLEEVDSFLDDIIDDSFVAG